MPVNLAIGNVLKNINLLTNCFVIRRAIFVQGTLENNLRLNDVWINTYKNVKVIFALSFQEVVIKKLFVSY